MVYNYHVMWMEKLKQMRIANNYSCKDIATIIGITKTYYWLIENNQRRLYYSMAKEIAKIFKLKPDDVFYEEVKELKN